MRWSMLSERSLEERQSMNSLQEKINYYYSNLETNTKGLRSQETIISTDMKQYLIDELVEMVERY